VRETVRPRTSSNFQPAVPAAPTENFQPPATDLVPLPEVQLGAVPIVAGAPQPQPAPPPPPPPAPTSEGPGSLPLGLAGGVGLIGGAALSGRSKREEETGSQLTTGLVKLGTGMAVVTGVAVGIGAGTIAIGTTAVVGPLLFAVGWGLVALGALDITSIPTAAPTGPAAHAGSVRG
jgi:hypothetical protein